MKFNIHALATVMALAACGLSLSACASPPGSTDGTTHAAARELRAFPATLDGYQRYVIELPAAAHEDGRKLELIGGREMTVDCNTRGMDGQFEMRDVKGWGYTYWVLQSTGQVRSTMMMCPPGTEKPGFVHAPPTLVRYNSKLPVVVFVPDGMALRWRLWRAGAEHAAQPG